MKDRYAGYVPPELARLRERAELNFHGAALAGRRLEALAGRVGIRPDIVELSEPLGRRGTGGPGRATPARRVGGADAGTGEEWREDAGPEPCPLDPAPGWACGTLRGGGRRAIGISVCGLDAAGLRRVVELVAARQRQDRDFVPVFLTDCDDFEVFGEYGFVFEYLPPADRRAKHPCAADWPAYAARRRRLVERKWALSEVICFGMGEFGR